MYPAVKNIWKSYIWTADKDMNESDPRSDVHYLGSSENKAWKKFQACTVTPNYLFILPKQYGVSVAIETYPLMFLVSWSFHAQGQSKDD